MIIFIVNYPVVAVKYLFWFWIRFAVNYLFWFRFTVNYLFWFRFA